MRLPKATIRVAIALVLFYAFAFAQQNPVQKLKGYEREMSRLAHNYESAGLFDKAAELYIALVLKNFDAANYLGAKRCLLKLNEYQRLESLLLQLQAQRRDIRFQIDMGEVKFLRGQKNDAIAYWNNLVDENSHNPQVYALLGATLLQNRLFDEAIELYKKGRKTLQDENLFIFELANIHAHVGDKKKALEEYIRYLNNNPQQIAFIDSRIAEMANEEEDTKEISNSLQKSIKEFKNISGEIYQLLGGLYTRNRDYENAFLYYKLMQQHSQIKEEKQKDDGRILYDLAVAAKQDSAFTLSKQVYQFIVDNYPATPYSLKAEYGLATLNESQGQYLAAIEAYEGLVKSHPQSNEALEAMLRIGDIWLNEQFDLNKARDAYQRIVNNYPGNSSRIIALNRLADCSIAQDNLDEAENVYKQILIASDNSADVQRNIYYKLALIRFYEGQLTFGIEFLNQAIKTITVSSEPDVQENDALDLYLLLQEKKSDSSGVATLGKAEHLLLQRKYDQGRDLLQTYAEENPDTFIKDELELILVKIYRTLGEFDKALSSCEELEAEESFYKDLALKLKAEIYEQDLKDFSKAQLSYETLLANFPESIYIESARKKIRELEKLLN